MTEWTSHFCTRCGGEAPGAFLHYVVSLVPGIVGLKIKANANPVRYRKAGMCRRCTLAIMAFIEESWHGENRDQRT